ncbi:hypothetical protein ATK17_0072 [Branchiibius hedensis]|uniref:Uncharacterized protein n=1 Tax=Branchiibius hedensis TaxID=672460 RepID=A0A2Y8ZSA7_9MICO|nr:hypothetical protein [Branchiibius hedensis]PWJ23989.1 hypothetical protein ATK17_0072 [Branchiibius hedensis]SSA32807.1 hypothetical protein SAMN04489750_0072 [Branchiibius hedensis]
MWPAILTLLPTIGLVYLFYVIMKHIMEADRRERIAQAQWDAARDAEVNASPPPAADPPAAPRT